MKMNWMKIIFNADDFGYSKATNFGIIDAFQNGVVRSTSILTNTADFEHAVELYHENAPKGLGVGIHLNLMMGRPLTSNLDTLTDANGNFYKHALFDSNKNYFDSQEMIQEFEAQITKALAAGIKLTHIDSHYGIHMQDPIFEVATKLAIKYNLPLRMVDANRRNPLSMGVKTADRFTGGFFAQNATLDYLVGYLDSMSASGAQVVEVLCRPAFVDLILFEGTRYSVNRINEHALLTSNELKGFIANRGYELVNYDVLN